MCAMEINYNKSEKIWVAPESDFTLHCGLGEAILATLEKDDQERVLEVFYDNGIQLTVGEIRQQTIAVAQNMQRLGIQKGDTVVVYSLFNEKITPITFGCYTIGAPINFFDTNLEEDDIDYLLQQLDPKLIVFEEQYRQKLFSSLERTDLPNLKHIFSLGTITPSVNNELFRESVDIDSFQIPDIGDPTINPAALVLTSGTTGRPKVIMLSHAFMYRGIYVHVGNIDTGTKCFVPTQPRWIGPILMMLRSVFLGHQRFYTAEKVSGTMLKHIIDTCKITNIIAVSTMYRDFLGAAESSNDASSLSSLKLALVSGEAVSDQLIDRLTNAMPNCNVMKCYGMTELGLVTAVKKISKKDEQGSQLRNGLMVKIIDDDGNPLGPNEMGQLLIKSTLPFLGYLKNEKANKESYLEDGWFNTGDYGYMNSDNLLNIITRYKFLVRSEGNIIVPMVIEDVVMAHPNVLTSALVGHPNPEDSNEEIGTVFVVLKNGAASKNIEDELRKLILSKCTKDQAKAVRNLRIIKGIPLTSCGKTDRIFLKKMACET